MGISTASIRRTLGYKSSSIDAESRHAESCASKSCSDELFVSRFCSDDGIVVRVIANSAVSGLPASTVIS